MIQLITTKDEDDRMPPAKVGKRLTREQVNLLTRWVEQGAKWKDHWSYIPPEQPELPRVKNKSWPRNEVDYFILARLEKEIETVRKALLEAGAKLGAKRKTAAPKLAAGITAHLRDLGFKKSEFAAALSCFAIPIFALTSRGLHHHLANGTSLAGEVKHVSAAER